ncbi:MAG TPA: pseudouridine synthase [Candidatus Alistipes intestinigallinarum]|uniref:Pseudouridine synthase n=1 Tax=Candidatus Alistipes intestinigallinarum TaxID=2838440 RepID=A0A9D2CCI0_9BACT|nr:pseudouridine synthase [Candidatus Alistipes intestinigallinarum]
MKDSKNDSTPVLERFARDKRKRTVIATAERVERRPRLQRDAADSEQPSHPYRPESRASYNPNFTAENRPRFEHPRREDEERPRRTFGERDNRYGDERPQRSYGERPRYGEHSRFEHNDRPRRTYGDSDNRYNEERPRRTFGDKPRFAGEHSRREEGERPRSYGPKGPKAAYGEKRSGKFDDRKGPKGGKFAAKGTEGRTFDKRSRKGADKPVSYPKYDPAVQTGEMRLNRFIAQSGICSRREADDFILAGVVSVNGKIVTELGTKVLPTDEVRFNDEPVRGEKKVYLVLNKPKGYVTSLDDPHAGKTVMELVKGACTERIYPVGRLDKNSLGLLLFTNDGDLTKQLTHPSYQKKKIYQVTLDKPLTRADMDRIAEGITLEDGEIFADEISYVKENKQEIGIEIHSGRNRIVRRIFEFLGYTVTKLDRVYYAGLTKKNLKRGAWRFLTREEVERLKSGLYE